MRRTAPAAEFDAPLSRCPVCRGERLTDFDRDAWNIRISRCVRCGVRFMNPQYTDRALRDFYARYVEDIEGGHSAERRWRRRRAKDQSLALVERFVSPGHLLSIGSGDGLEIEVALSRGWSVLGYDVDEESAQEIAARTGVEMLSGDLLDHDFGGRRFDCIFMDQVLEHVKEPGAYLRHVHALLKPTGVLYIGTPNIGSLSSRWKTLLGRAGLKRRSRGKHYDTWHHLSYYTPSALREILERHHGFEVLLNQGDPKPARRETMLRRAADGLRTRYPLLDSSQRVLARPKRSQRAALRRTVMGPGQLTRSLAPFDQRTAMNLRVAERAENAGTLDTVRGFD